MFIHGYTYLRNNACSSLTYLNSVIRFFFHQKVFLFEGSLPHPGVFRTVLSVYYLGSFLVGLVEYLECQVWKQVGYKQVSVPSAAQSFSNKSWNIYRSIVAYVPSSSEIFLFITDQLHSTYVNPKLTFSHNLKIFKFKLGARAIDCSVGRIFALGIPLGISSILYSSWAFYE